MDCPPNKIRNPQTNICITINGLTHRKLIKEGILPPYNKCKDNEILNPKSKRCIKIGTFLYKKLVKEGVINVGNVENNVRNVVNEVNEVNVVNEVNKPPSKTKSSSKSPKSSKSSKSSKKTNSRKCKNKDTFLMFDNVDDIEDDDFIKTSDGYCFSAKELIAYVNDGNFNNKNPHIPFDLFKKSEIDTLLKNHPVLLEKVKEYFEKEIKKQLERDNIFEKTIDTLYMVGDAGRTCYFNNLTSFEKDDSSFFQRSIECLQKLSESLSKLKSGPEKAAYADVKKIVEYANKGEMCIHGVGLRLINLFIQYFKRLKVKYDPLKSGIYFFNPSKNVVQMCSVEHRFSPTKKRLMQNHISLQMNIQSLVVKKPDMITKMNEKTEHYNQMCNYEPYLVTENTLDEWKELSDWRKIKFGKDMCFDVLYLVKVITDNLNNSKNNNPDPKFPTNPFTQAYFTPDEIKLIKYTLEDNFIKINPALECFVSSSELWKFSANWKDRLISKLEAKLRFVRLNNIIGGELHCHGMWNSKTTPINATERNILQYLNTARPDTLRLLIRKPSETVPDAYYYEIRKKMFLNSDNFILWE